MKNCFLSVLFLGFFSMLHSQTPTWNVAIPYETTNHLDVVKKMIKTNDNGFLILMHKGAFDGFSRFRHYMLKYNEHGALEWEKEYDFGITAPSSGSWSGARPRDIIQLENDNFFMTGTYADADTSYCYIFVTDSNGGSLLYESTPCYRDLNYTYERIFTHYFDSLLNYYFVELTESNMTLNQFPLEEEVIWNLIVNDSLNIFKARGLGFGETSVQKLNIDGALLQETSSPYVNDIFVINEENSISSYYNDLIKLDADLNEIWSVPFEEIFPDHGSGAGFTGTDIIHTIDSGYVFTGSYTVEIFSIVYIVKYNKEGGKEWGGLYGSSVLPLEHIHNIVEVEDGYVFVGTNATTKKIWLVKVNEEGVFTDTKEIVKHPSYITLFPNPSTDNITLNFQDAFSGHIQIINAAGQTILNEKITTAFAKNYNVNNLPVGHYIIQIVSDRGAIRLLPFIKQ